MPLAILCSTFLLRATCHEDCPESEDHIRVKDYASQMVVKPHKTFQEVEANFTCFSDVQSKAKLR